LYEVKVNEDGGSAAFIERLMGKFDTKMCEKIANDVIDGEKKHPRREELPNWCEENEVVWKEDLGDDVTEFMSAAFPEGREGDKEKEEEEYEVMVEDGGVAGAGGGGGGKNFASFVQERYRVAHYYWSISLCLLSLILRWPLIGFLLLLCSLLLVILKI